MPGSTKWALKYVGTAGISGGRFLRRSPVSLATTVALFELKDMSRPNAKPRMLMFQGTGASASAYQGRAQASIPSWIVFETEKPYTFEDFTGWARMGNVSAGVGKAISSGFIVFNNIDIKQAWWRGDEIDLTGIGAGTGVEISYYPVGKTYFVAKRDQDAFEEDRDAGAEPSDAGAGTPAGQDPLEIAPRDLGVEGTRPDAGPAAAPRDAGADAPQFVDSAYAPGTEGDTLDTSRRDRAVDAQSDAAQNPQQSGAAQPVYTGHLRGDVDDLEVCRPDTAAAESVSQGAEAEAAEMFDFGAGMSADLSTGQPMVDPRAISELSDQAEGGFEPIQRSDTRPSAEPSGPTGDFGPGGYLDLTTPQQSTLPGQTQDNFLPPHDARPGLGVTPGAATPNPPIDRPDPGHSRPGLGSGPGNPIQRGR
ncbi:MAG: hypothetical protein QNJ16_13995 [Rhodobacter sp.]|nr:hypothetical protein [Rhodobacter sp.]